MKTGEKIALGVGAAALAGGLAYALWPKKAAAASGGSGGGTGPTIDADGVIHLTSGDMGSYPVRAPLGGANGQFSDLPFVNIVTDGQGTIHSVTSSDPTVVDQPGGTDFGNGVLLPIYKPGDATVTFAWMDANGGSHTSTLVVHATATS